MRNKLLVGVLVLALLGAAALGGAYGGSQSAASAGAETSTVEPSATYSSTSTPAPSATFSSTAVPPATVTNSPSATPAPTETPNFQATLEAAIAAYMAAHPPATPLPSVVTIVTYTVPAVSVFPAQPYSAPLGLKPVEFATTPLTTVPYVSTLKGGFTAMPWNSGKWQEFAPQLSGPYEYVQVNNMGPDVDYVVSLVWRGPLNMGGWLVQPGNGTWTEVVFTVRTSIAEVQFNQPYQGVQFQLWRVPGDVAMAREAQNHAENIAKARSWLRVYNVGDLWVSLNQYGAGEPTLLSLVKCIDPAVAGIPSCQDPGFVPQPR